MIRLDYSNYKKLMNIFFRKFKPTSTVILIYKPNYRTDLDDIYMKLWKITYQTQKEPLKSIHNRPSNLVTNIQNKQTKCQIQNLLLFFFKSIKNESSQECVLCLLFIPTLPQDRELRVAQLVPPNAYKNIQRKSPQHNQNFV